MVDEKLFLASGYTASDLNSLKVNIGVFNVFYAGLTFKNVVLTTDYPNDATSQPFLKPVRIDTKVLKIIDVEYRGQGLVMFSESTSFNWHMENFYIDTYRVYQVFYLFLR